MRGRKESSTAAVANRRDVGLVGYRNLDFILISMEMY